ncbi:type I polyketide synthase [Peterkaempfera bronchialis]|uniref:type I polyketide synthase n=1 Tax=Peterkaempfera bronchialis TaxID=2126346 RepID=UPI003C2D2544
MRSYTECTAGSDQDDALAVVGIACRLPGATTPEMFWKLLLHGRSAITEAPAGRWENTSPDDGGIRLGGFLDAIDLFDADFFGISPREAAAADPQQRLALELAWEAVEESGIVPGTLEGSRTGVFIGAILDDYAALTYRHAPASLTRHTLAGTQRSMIANRVSYHLGLRGPSLTVDSGQSSSLVAVHLACESLRRGESTLALAGGVHLNLLAESTLRVARFGGLSPDGRCHTFDARANGYVRGEGGGAVLLKPLARALADGDRIHCVIRGSAINNDGAAEGLTVPDAQAQQDVLREACRQAGVAPADLQYVELHGTGTRVGDPIEAAALGAAVGTARAPDSPLAVGSAKTNVGHLEGGAGIVGLLKTVLSVEHGRLPPSLNFATPNPEIPLDALNLRVPRQPEPWPQPDRPRLAGVSSFGLGGTNCHVVVAEAPVPGPTGRGRQRTGGAVPWLLSGRSATALRAQAERLHRYIEDHPDLDPADTGLALATTRTAFEHRAAVVGERREDFLPGLAALAAGASAAHLVEGVANPGGTVFLFPGQGSQWAGMAVELAGSHPVFADTLSACEKALAPYTDWSLTDVLRGGGSAGPSPLDRVDVVQPVLFAVMVSLAALWGAAGVRPEAVAGHSQGEIAAAHVAGALSLEDAARLVALRSRAVRALSGRGGMASVPLRADALADRLAAWGGRLEVAVVNGPAATVVSGDADALDELLAAFATEGVDARRVAVDYASHSAQVEAIREPLLASLAGIAPRTSDIPFYSTVTGGPVDTACLDADYWYRNLRQTVRFEPTVRALLAAGHRSFVEVSPHPVLTGSLQDIFESALGPGGADSPADADSPGGAAFATGTLRRGDGSRQRFVTSLAQVHVHGAAVDWAAVFADTGARPVPLPTYAFQRERHWLDLTPGGPAAVTPTVVPRGPAVPPVAATAQPDGGSLAQRLAMEPEAEQYRLLLETVRTEAAVVVGRTAESVEVRRPFKEMGFDSPAIVELRNRLGAATGLRLPTSLVFNHPTPAVLAAHLRDLLCGDGPARPPAVLAELDRLEAALAAASLDDGETRDAVAVRLRHLLDRVDHVHRPQRQPNGDLTRTILSATPEEIFDLIDNRGPL